ncbi:MULTISPECIES: glycosyltransferase [Limosilactobacillus]|uniref:glycosyltransferase n=1 Tax=Limosilactobacillus TaxID=2742598 RepID=UPI00280A82C3|nr:glycosyltransferase [Limosilactobacillus fermentum]
MTNKIAILMATYNGDKYLREQLESIIRQTNNSFELFIQDDGSNDNTMAILQEFDNLYTNIHLVKKKANIKGQLANFSSLYGYVTSLNKYEYIMFSDQDDIWFPYKIDDSINKMKEFCNKPTLLYTNYIKYDQNTNQKVEAYPKHYVENFESIFVQNWLMGCTMVLNKKMIELIKEIPLNVDNHDYWIALVAALNNDIVYFEEPTMLHRLHNNNVTTRATKNNLLKKINKIFDVLFNKDYRSTKIKMWQNVKNELMVRYSSRSIDDLANILNINRFKAIKMAKTCHFRGMNSLSTISFYVMLFLR